MHNNQNILTLLFIIILIKTKNTEKALLISEDTNKAIYYLFSFNHAMAYSAYTADAADSTLSSIVNRLLW